ncbi:hypothetical protein FB45DRAFT_1021857 [Roridomyces roridus]|uniref:Uncharacterized protein n=1 Tax=Roridomyces roridus TaxID=1738132 RepID=A0AAD7C777_9AGAR|nr:hypothetical protein FB45DRAFT_1021857 [Roridomyces roridus]
MGDGLGYFCKRESEDGYKAYIEKHASEQEVSNCSGFQAMFMANTRRVKGLRTTGVGGVTCSRHNMWRPNGMGDLQVGERYCNMEFLLLSAVLHFSLLCLVVSYDIACQFSIHFWDRMSKMPSALQLKIPRENLWWKVPNFHLPPHKKRCHGPYSFHWMPGAGMTHGETVEQNWALDKISDHVLPKRLAVAIQEGTKHQAAFDTFTSGLEAVRPEQLKEWKAMVIEWESKQHTDSSDQSPCPFEVADEVTTLRDIQVQIATEEYICTEDGLEIEREHTLGAFVSMGLDLEEAQRRLEIDVRALKEPSPTQRLGFTKRRTALLKRIHKFRELQRIYMPALRSALSETQKQIFDGNGEQLPEATRLFMPSEIADAGRRRQVCATGLPDIEARLRLREAEEALNAVRNGLRTRTMTNRYKLRNWTGQGMMTKGQGILRQINIKIHTAKLRYCYARAAVLVLRGHGDWEDRLCVLNDDDVRALNERALTVEEKAQNAHWAELGGAVVEGGVDRASALARGEGSHTLSWIWYTAGVGARRVTEEEEDLRLHETLRLEWCKAYLRARRYSEEVRLLREEMRRTIAFGRSEVAEWEWLARSDAADVALEVAEGRRAYAEEHAETERQTCEMLARQWAGILRKADQYLEGNGAFDVDLTDELDPEEEEARLEAEAQEEEY